MLLVTGYMILHNFVGVRPYIFNPDLKLALLELDLDNIIDIIIDTVEIVLQQ